MSLELGSKEDCYYFYRFPLSDLTTLNVSWVRISFGHIYGNTHTVSVSKNTITVIKKKLDECKVEHDASFEAIKNNIPDTLGTCDISYYPSEVKLFKEHDELLDDLHEILKNE